MGMVECLFLVAFLLRGLGSALLCGVNFQMTCLNEKKPFLNDLNQSELYMVKSYHSPFGVKHVLETLLDKFK